MPKMHTDDKDRAPAVWDDDDVGADVHPLSPRGLPMRPLTAADLEQMRRAHMAEVEASQRCERRFSRRRSDRALVEARRDEKELLDQFGFSSYGDFVVSAWRIGAERVARADRSADGGPDRTA